MTSVDAREIEWQFDAVDLRSVVRWLDEPAGWEEEGLGPVRVAPAGRTTTSTSTSTPMTDDFSESAIRSESGARRGVTAGRRSR